LHKFFISLALSACPNHTSPLHLVPNTDYLFCHNAIFFFQVFCLVLLCCRCSVQRYFLLQSALNRCTVRPLTESDDTRCCNNTI
jgi:hypothetical protein